MVRIAGNSDARDERGALLVMFAILLVVLLGFSALVVDLGMARSKKRQIQNTADSSALAAAQVLPVTATADADAKSYASTNLSDGSFPWSTCTDSAPLTQTASSPCISYDTSYNRVRVKVPQQSYTTLFGRILGRSTMRASAAAEARVRNAGLSGTLPFSLFSGAGSGEVCIKSNSNGTAPPPCDGSTNGNFNMLDVNQFGNAVLNTTPCNNGENERIEQNIAMGIDHDLTIYAGTTITDACYNAGPNTLRQSTGNKSSSFDSGILHGSGFPDGGNARLRRTSVLAGVGYASTRTVAGATIDNTGLWQFVNPSIQGSGSVPATCWPSVFAAVLTNPDPLAQQLLMHAALATCIADYRNGGYTGTVFDRDSASESPLDIYDIQLSTRFAYLPQFAQSGPCGNGYCLQVLRFRAVYLQTLFGGCSGSSCDINYEPGPWNPASVGAGNKKADQISGWVIPARMLPGNIGDGPGIIGQNRYVELVK